MRAGMLLSVIGHVALLLWGFVLFAHPTPFQTVPPDAITVDIVPASEIAAKPSQPAVERAEAAPAPREAAPAGKPETIGSVRPQQPPPPRAAPPSQPEPPGAQQSLLVYNSTVAPVPDLPLPTRGTENAFGGFDAPADRTAALPADVIAELKAHLQRCWNPPPGAAAAQKLKVVLRVSLEPGGALAAQPMLLEASASPQGPALVEAAVRAVKQCQPYSFLPAQKYQEWRVLDLKFTPQGIAGG